METVVLAMDAPMDPYAPWLGAEDLELLQTFHDPHANRHAQPHLQSHPTRQYLHHSHPSAHTRSPSQNSSSSGDDAASYAHHHHHHQQQQQQHQHQHQPPHPLHPSYHQHHHAHRLSHTQAIASSGSGSGSGSATGNGFGGSFLDLMTSHPPAHARGTALPGVKSIRRGSSSSSASASSVPPSQPPLKKTRRASASSAGVSSPASSTDSHSALVVAAGGESTLTAEEERREKNRQKVRRHYYRKLNQLNTLRDQVTQLEGQYQKLSDLKQSETSGAVMTTTALARLERLDATRLTLEEENEHLHLLTAQQEAQLSHLRETLTSEHDDFSSSDWAKSVAIKPFATHECHAVQHAAIRDALALCGSRSAASASSKARHARGPGIGGWHDDVSVEDGIFKFLLTKTFHNSSPKSLSGISWPMLTEPVVLARLYSAAIETKCAVVQQVDENNVVMFQEYKAMDKNNACVLMKSLFLVTRTETATGELLVLRGLSKDRLQDRELFLPSSGSSDADGSSDGSCQVVWHDLFVWFKFDRAGLHGEDCKATFGGTAPTVGHNMAFWSVEVLNLVLRWECAIFGPPQMLPSAIESDTTTGSRTTSSPPPPPSPTSTSASTTVAKPLPPMEVV